MSRLENENRLTVIVDDRGKLIVITEDELKGVADIIKKEGRISLSRLTKMCGFVNMQGSVNSFVCLDRIFTRYQVALSTHTQD